MRNQPFTALQPFVARHSYHLLLLLFLAWMCVGVFPLLCYEGDSMHNIAGCSTLCNQGFTVPPIYSYEYDMQPLVFYVVAGACRLLPFMNCEEMFCLLAAVAAALTVVVSVGFIHRLTGIRREWILFAMFLLPESVAIGMYPNTAILAMLPFVVALDCLSRRKLKRAVAWMCLAPLFRVDILMVYPVILFIFLWQKDTFGTALRKSVLSAAVIVAAATLGYWLLQADPFQSTLNHYGHWNGKTPLYRNLQAILSFYTALGFPLFLGGLCLIGRKKDWRLLMMVLVPVVLNHIVYGKMGCATKHYLYILPFVATAVTVCLVRSCDWLRTKGKVKKIAAAGALAAFLLVSVRISIPSHPWRDNPQGDAQTGPCLTLWKENRTPLRLSAGIGAGFPLRTADENMLASGNLFYPLFIHELKANKAEARAKAREHLASLEKYTLLGILSWEGRIHFPMVLLGEGYSFNPVQEEGTSRNFVLRSPGGEKEIMVATTNKPVLFADTKDYDTRKRFLEECATTCLATSPAPMYVFECDDKLDYFYDQFVEDGLMKKISYGLYQVCAPKPESGAPGHGLRQQGR